jgi:hypothetical protein
VEAVGLLEAVLHHGWTAISDFVEVAGQARELVAVATPCTQIIELLSRVLERLGAHRQRVGTCCRFEQSTLRPGSDWRRLDAEVLSCERDGDVVHWGGMTQAYRDLV